MKVKKIQMISVALILFFSCTFLSYSRKVNVYADEYVGFSKTPNEFDDNTIFKEEYDTFLEAYYTNLIDNIGYNLKGSCGYVALGMLLSYYDTYQSDKIISKEYDCPSEYNTIKMLEPNMNKRHKSPGIYSDEIVKADFEPFNVEKANALSAEQYYDIIKKKADINSDEPSLHAKLLTIGHDLGYYGKLSHEQPGGDNTSNGN